MEIQNQKLIHSELSYVLNGIAIEVRKELGRFAREKQYADLFEKKLIEKDIPHKRELTIGDSGNRLDFNIDDCIIVDAKAKRFVLKEDYRQMQNYLHVTGLELGIIYNFREQYVKPHRILRVAVP